MQLVKQQARNEEAGSFTELVRDFLDPADFHAAVKRQGEIQVNIMADMAFFPNSMDLTPFSYFGSLKSERLLRLLKKEERGSSLLFFDMFML